jgi:aminomethyltransferase
MDTDRFMLVVNASNIDKDWAWVTSHSVGRAEWKNVSDETALLAVQGPRAEALVGRLADRDVTGIAYYHFAPGAVAGVPALISRTGYTGEDGFELYLAASQAERLWSALIEAGRPDGLRPIGLGAREMKYALYGNDIDQTTNPLEAGLGWVVKPGKGDFIGRDAIEALRARGVARRLVGFEMAERAVPRHGYRLMAGGAPVGVVTSGSFGPSVERSIGMGYVPSAQSTVGCELAVEIRGATHAARVVKTPFHPSHTKKV